MLGPTRLGGVAACATEANIQRIESVEFNDDQTSTSAQRPCAQGVTAIPRHVHVTKSHLLIHVSRGLAGPVTLDGGYEVEYFSRRVCTSCRDST